MCIQQCSNNPQNIYLHISNLSICSTQKEPEQGLQLGLFSGEQSESLFAVRRLMESFYEKFVQSSSAQFFFVEHLLQVFFSKNNPIG